MSINTNVEQIAYGHATAQVLSELGQQENWYKAYEYLSECVERGDEPEDLVVCQLLEHWEWKDILDQIESEAESLRKRKLTAVCSHQTRIGNLDAHLI
ncbi:hypothetical protein [Escherichia coli]|uniref:hypothetical protein n=1 Tax=Escherichia coli TaxID=562 RepID=UPI00208DAB41|nr:hypothetical protein [Escherichia coli]MCV8132186.1 hypothetical protein [Escherichia coli]